jgi:hypothetical protein
MSPRAAFLLEKRNSPFFQELRSFTFGGVALSAYIVPMKI